MKSKGLVATITALIVGFAIGLGIKTAYEITAFQPYHWGEKIEPIIINCYGEDFSAGSMERAIKFWVEKGHMIGFYEHNPPSNICENEHLEGFIIIRKGSRFQMESGVLAKTRRWTSFTKLTAAVITYRPGTQNLMWINEHELGHALGYAHYKVDGHIMHPLFHKMEGKFWIP